MKVKGKKKIKTKDGKIVYEDVNSEEEIKAYPKDKLEVKIDDENETVFINEYDQEGDPIIPGKEK